MKKKIKEKKDRRKILINIKRDRKRAREREGKVKSENAKILNGKKLIGVRSA